MQYTAHVLFVLSLVIHSFTSSLPEILCSDGKPGVTVQLAPARLHPFHPAIYSTDCSRNPIRKKRTSLEKRQEYICPADAPPRCTNDSPQRPSASDCSQLLSFLNNRASQFTVQDLQTVTVDSGTCRFSLQNLVSSSFIYCDTAWASRSSSVINSCFSSNNGGFAQGSRFSAIVGYNPTYQAPAANPPPPASSSPASTQPNSGINPNGGSSSGGGTNNNNNNNNNSSGGSGSNNSGGSSSNGAGSAQTGGASNPNASGSANGATSASTGAGGTSTSSGVLVTNVVVSGSTTLSGGSVVAATITLSSLSLPGFGASPTDLSANRNGNDANDQTKGRAPYLIPAIVGSLLGALAILLLLLFCLWRRKKQASLRKQSQEMQQEIMMREADNERGEEETLPIPYDISHTRQNPHFGDSQESLAGAAALAKARLAAEETRLGSTSNGRERGHQQAPSLENASSITNDSVFSPGTSAAPPYRARSERRRHGGNVVRSTSSSSSSGHHRNWRGAFASGTVASETVTSLVSPSTTGSESSRRPPSTRRHYHSHRTRGNGGDSIDSGSISARTLAQTAAPNLSETDIDRLAESIVARIHGRDPTLTEQARHGQGSSQHAVDVLSEEDEPPPPWSAPENNRQSLRGL